MIVLQLNKCKPSVKGYVSRWLLQPRSGLFVGHLSGRVREMLWTDVREMLAIRGGSAVLVYPIQAEPGYRIEMYGDTQRVIRDFDGLCLPKTPLNAS